MLLEATTAQTIIREISADLETPVSLYLKLRGQGASFLLESVEGGERIARYSFIGVQPRAEYILRNGEVEVKEPGEIRTITLDPYTDPTQFLQAEIERFPAQQVPGARPCAISSQRLRPGCKPPTCPMASTCWPIPLSPSTTPVAVSS
jgi:anthranilate/para-aminobenzoate synthase component I